MSLIVLLFAIGILLIAFEVIVPGAILGTIGGVLMFIGCVMAFMTFGNVGGMTAVGTAFAVGALALFLEFRVLPNTRFGKRAFLTSEITAVSAALGTEAQRLIGRPAEALTMLSPSGYVRVDGQRYEAFSQSGQVPAGSTLEITGADSFRLIVSLSKTTDLTS
ncbi:MAG: serine protease [Verrucomicrobiaceae bacterium]|nr:MAG: serine protease [Verrucomicrobiaceae bacterium]